MVFVALPVALAFRLLKWTRPSAVFIPSFVVGALCFAAMAWFFSPGPRQAHPFTEWGRAHLLAGCAGLVAGLVFWAVLKCTGELEAIKLGSPEPVRSRAHTVVWLSGIGVALCIIALAWPYLIATRGAA